MNGLYFIVLSNPFQQIWSLTKITSSAPSGWRELIEVARCAPNRHPIAENEPIFSTVVLAHFPSKKSRVLERYKSLLK